MYTALIFVGIISLSNCRPEIPPQIHPQEQQQTKPNALLNCPDLSAKQQFNATAYFHDVWHVVRSFYPDTPSNKSEEMAYIKITSQILENRNVRQLYTQILRRSKLQIDSITILDDIKNEAGKFISRPIDKEGNLVEPNFPLQTTVIDTDYSNYAVEHKCLPLRNGLLNVYLILNRKPHTLDPNVEAILNKLKLKLQDFTAMSQTDCAKA